MIFFHNPFNKLLSFYNWVVKNNEKSYFQKVSFILQFLLHLTFKTLKAICLTIMVTLWQTAFKLWRILFTFSIWCLNISLQSWKLSPPPTATPVTRSDFRNMSANLETDIWKASSLGIFVSPFRKLWKIK